MSMRDLITVFFAIVILLGGWFLYTYVPEKEWQAFYAEGNLVRDTPGLTPGRWYLVYEEPGFPGLSVPLMFDAASKCAAAGAEAVCDGSFLVGDRVQIEGVRTEEHVLVKKLIFTKPSERGIPIRLYYYNPSRDTDPAGNIICSAAGLEYVERVLPHTTTPLKDSLQLLLRGEISDEERVRGITSEFPLLGVRLEAARIEEGVATLTFSDPNHKTGGGSCRVAILWAQVAATAKQFSSVKEVRFLPEELFQP